MAADDARTRDPAQASNIAPHPGAVQNGGTSINSSAGSTTHSSSAGLATMRSESSPLMSTSTLYPSDTSPGASTIMNSLVASSDSTPIVVPYTSTVAPAVSAPAPALAS